MKLRAAGLPLGARRHRERPRRPTTRRWSSSARGPRRTSSRCGARSSRSTSGASSRPTTTRRSTSTSRRSSAPARSRWSSGRRASSSRCVPTRSYWGGTPKVDEIFFQLYTNQDTLAQDLKLGTIDLAINIPPAQVKALQGDAGLDVRGLFAEGLRLPVASTATRARRSATRCSRDVKFRQALNWGIDKDKLTELAYQGYADPGNVDLRGQLLRPQPRLALAAAGRRQVHVRPREGQAAARRRRLQGHRRRRHPQRPQQRRQEHQAAPLVAHAVAAEPGHGQAHHRLVEGPRPRHPVLGRGQRHAHRRRLQLRRRHLQARLRHLHLGVAAERLRPRPPSRLLPHRRRSRTRTTACWSNPQYDELWQQQSQELDPQKRKEIAYKMQEILYEAVAVHRARPTRSCSRRGTRRRGRAGSASRSPTAPSPTSATTSATTTRSRPRWPTRVDQRRRLEHHADRRRRGGGRGGVAIVLLLLRRKPRAEEG